MHTEKPVALRYDEAKALAELAATRGLRLSCAPATVLGEALQTAWKLVREGALGTVRAVYAEANWGRIESWHPSPQALYDVGPLVDVGVYPLTALTAIFGPVRAGERVRDDPAAGAGDEGGTPFTLTTPDFVVAALELEAGPVVRLTATFWVGPGRQRGIEFHGDGQSLYLATWGEFDSRLELSRDGEAYEPVPLVREPFHGIDWSRPLVDLAEAIARRPAAPGRRRARCARRRGAERGRTAARAGGAVEVARRSRRPSRCEWAR